MNTTTIRIGDKKHIFNRKSKKEVLIDSYVFTLRENDVMSVTWIDRDMEGNSFLLVAIDDKDLERKAEMLLGLNGKDVGADYFNGALVLSSLTKKGIKILIKFIKDTIDYLNRIEK
jgi:hypothetical protein